MSYESQTSGIVDHAVWKNLYEHGRGNGFLTGGVVTSGLAIYDTMQYVRPHISTVCIGQCASMGSLLLAAGEKGKRFALPNSRIMVHQPSGGSQGDATDIKIQAEQIIKTKARINKIIADETGRSLEQVEKDTDRDYWMSVEEATEYGIVGKVIKSIADIS